MEARELRIGNLIQLYRRPTDNEMSIGVIIGVDDTNVELEDYFVVNHKKGISPIPLTEEWFKEQPRRIKEWKGNGADYQPETSKTEQIYYELFEDCFCVFETWSYRKDEYSEWINEHSVFVIYSDNQISLYKHEVHVLQNLIFALTGEELTIK